MGGAASPSTKPSAEEVRSATQPNAFSLLFNGCVACGVRATVQLRSAHIRTLEVMAALKRENGTLQARVAELEKPNSDASGAFTLEQRVAELEKPNSDGSNLEARVAELEKPNSDGADLQLELTKLTARVVELEKPNSDTTP